MTTSDQAHLDDPEINYLPRSVVQRRCAELDPCAVVAATLVAHAGGDTVLPDEAYLGWTGPDGAAARSLAMPGAVADRGRQLVGVKVINASLGNPARGMARAQGLVLLFDELTGRVRHVLEAAHISATRTAAVTIVTAQALCATPPRTLAVLGCGELARVHLELAARALPSLECVRLLDTVPERADALAEQLPSLGRWQVSRPATPIDCVAGADLVVTCTNVSAGYLPLAAFAPGAVIAHVSLDDVLPDVVHGAELVLVDDWNLVAADRRRLLGRMVGAGELLGPHDAPEPGRTRVAATLGDILTGAHPGRRSDDGVILSNPFGMAILDVALASAVAETMDDGEGVHLLPV